jgi:hypothetical protein
MPHKRNARPPRAYKISMSRRRPLKLLLSLILATAILLTTSMLLQNRPDSELVDIDSITNFDLDQRNGTINDIPTSARSLEGHEIRIRGKMWAPQSTDNSTLSFFQLTDLPHHGGVDRPPLAQDFIACHPTTNARVSYFDDPVIVTGTWHVAINRDSTGMIKSVFQIDVDRVDPAPATK